MTRTKERGEVVLAPDPYSGKTGRRPFLIISDSNYPFYPHGALALPITSKDKSNTFEITEYDKEEINEDLHINPSYVNPYSPVQCNNAGKTLLTLSDDFCDLLAERVSVATGLGEQ